MCIFNQSMTPFKNLDLGVDLEIYLYDGWRAGSPSTPTVYISFYQKHVDW